MLCDEVSLVLAGSLDRLPNVSQGSVEDEQLVVLPDVAILGLPAARHVEGCQHCQTEFVQYVRLQRNLRSLRVEAEEPDSELLGEILDAVRPPATVHQLHGREKRIAYLGGIAAAATAGAAGALVWASKVVPGRKAS